MQQFKQRSQAAVEAALVAVIRPFVATRSQRGQGVVEFILFLLLAVVLLFGFGMMGGSRVNNTFSTASSAINVPLASQQPRTPARPLQEGLSCWQLV